MRYKSLWFFYFGLYVSSVFFKKLSRVLKITELSRGIAVLFLIFLICFPAFVQSQDYHKNDILPAKLVVNENSIITRADRAMLGYNHEWGGTSIIVMNNSDIRTLELAEDYLNIFKGYPMPLNRMSGTVSQVFKWKWAIGSLEERKEQKLTDWDSMSRKRLGPIEWIKSVLLIDPNAKFTWTLNMTETPADHADLAEFLTGDGNSNPNAGVNWAQKRIELGVKEPVDIIIWELGNELDMGKHREYFPTVDVYIEACKKAIAEVKKVYPQAKFAAHAATAVFATEYHNRYGGWEAWHRKVLEQLGNQIDYIVYHPYYNDKVPPDDHENYMDIIRADILKITGSNRIKFYLSEHAQHPGHISPETRPTWYQTHALSGTLLTAEWINRMLNRGDVAVLAYHSFSSGPWGLIYRDEKTRKLYTTGVADLFKVLNRAFGKNVVKTSLSGDFTDVKKTDCTLTAATMTTGEGLNIILVNRDPATERKISFEFKGRYRLMKETILTAGNMDAHNTPDRKEFTVTTKDINSEEVFSFYNMPSKSIIVFYLNEIDI